MRHLQNSPVETPCYELTPFSPRECFHALKTPIRFLKGVGPARAALFESVGLNTVEDLLYHLPFRYEDRREIKKINQATVGVEDSFIGRLVALDKRYVPRWRRQILTGKLADETGSLHLVWFYPKPYITERLTTNGDYMVYGKVEGGRGSEKRIVHPQFEPIENGQEKEMERILPVYLRLGGLPLGMIRKLVPQALSKYRDYLPSFLPLDVAHRQQVSNIKEALTEIHQPGKDSDIASLELFSSKAHRSIVFDEFFYLQLGMALQRKHRTILKGIPFSSTKEGITARMRRLIPFKLTGAQERVLQEVHKDMEFPRPMQRLIQGDVGSGKTIVAWLAAVRAIENGFQAAMMAPTELLADQHYSHLKNFADQLKIPAALLIGSLPAAEKREITRRIADGEVKFVVGTHALIQESVSIPKLGLGIIDEQHRFGVVQRSAMKRLSNWKNSTSFSLPQPDVLLMSATPIPRSLAMVLYGDMEVSSLDEMPPGRTPVQTKVFKESQRAQVYELVREEIRKGHQAYIVYPLVEESERLPLKDATGMANEFSQVVFKQFRVGLLHGRVAADEKEQIMRRFKEGELQILVATTVIEVGIDVPNATVMMVEHAERFGLSQLHQLRGRVGRGKDQSHCFLLQYGTQSREAYRRLRAMEELQNGFKIAEVDLQLRGPGEILGTRQSGLPDFRLASVSRDAELLLKARKEALEWLAADPFLKGKESRAMKEVLKHRWSGRLELGSIG